MDRLVVAMERSSLTAEKPDWSFDKILQSFPTEICHMIAEQRQMPNARPVPIRLSNQCLNGFVSVLNGCDCPADLRGTIWKAYYKNTTFQMVIGSLVWNARPALKLFLDQVKDNVQDLTTFRIRHPYFTVVINVTPKEDDASIENHLESCRLDNGDDELFEYVAGHMLGDAKSLIESEMTAKVQSGLSRKQLEQLVKTVCKLGIVRHMVEQSWICVFEDEALDSSVLPDDGLLQEYVAYALNTSHRGLDLDSSDPWIFE
ncbi:hypothetical protein DOTSEDRAFT_75486 [Dothistroma septosporum NZE10]|uniref:Uncharacterized protein n=1 Tax=Dothistroma septosporum (strain NZE10 / CBS 128990) TaxID=675120 RepID=M2YIJ2_DOTSN|nr:hypothetical protein DOTSEDRAFT_75486 [Dothistroma septosporum NZE10]